MSSRRALAASLVLLAVLGAGAATVTRHAESAREARAREATAQVASRAAFAVEQQLSRSLSATYALAAMVRPRGTIDDFGAIAEELLAIYGGLGSVQLAPGGVISQIHPREGNAAAVGHDLLRDPARRELAQRAIDTRELTVAGPLDLVQGGVGVVGRLAVFRRDRSSPGGERFWGFTIAVVRVDELLAHSQLQRLAADGYAYELVHAPPGAPPRRLAASAAPLGAAVARLPVRVPGGGAWELAVSQEQPPGDLPLESALAITAALAISGLAYVVLRQPERLRREVEAKTAELARANERLAAEAERQRRTEAALRESQKLEAVGQLAGGIAHDFNNLLTGIIAHADLLAEEAHPGSDERESATVIVGAARRAAELTRQLLGFARRGKLRAAPLDAHAVAREAAALLSRSLDKSIALELRLEAPESVIVGDAGQLEQALVNLAVNARDAMPSGGRITVRSWVIDADAAWCERHPGASPGRHLALAVDDTGCGIPPELRERVFEPFFTTKGPGRGTGMGLAMVYGIARNHGGTVELASEEGHGTRFTLYLPLHAGPAPASRPAAAEPPVRGSGRVLVVDDDPLPRAAAEQLLGAAGYEVTAFGDPAAAVRWFSEHHHDCDAVLLDLAMPAMDGRECFRALRAVEPAVRVVLTSGYEQDGRAQELLDEGVVAFLPKPFDAATLGRAMRDAIAPGRQPQA